MIKTRVIYTTGVPLSKRLAEKLFIDKLNYFGISIDLLDLSNLHYSNIVINNYLGQDSLDISKFDTVRKPKSYRELYKILREYRDKNCIFWMLDWLQIPMTRRLILFRALRLKYIIYRSSLDEGLKITYGYENDFLRLLYFIYRRNFSVIVRKISTLICINIYENTTFMAKPEICFSSGKIGYKIFKNSGAREYVSIPSLLVEWENNNTQTSDHGHIVFIESSVKAGRDRFLAGHALEDENKYKEYFSDITNFLNKLSLDLRCKVTVAASGKYLYSKGEFKNIPIVYGDTYNLISSASIVIGHNSHCCWQAVVENKPLIVATHRSFSHVFRSEIEFIAQTIGVGVTNLSEDIQDLRGIYEKAINFDYSVSFIERLCDYKPTKNDLNKMPTKILNLLNE